MVVARRKKSVGNPGIGYSPHGWGVAQDFDVNNGDVFAWLRANAPKYGLYLQGPPAYLATGPNPEYEPWHWQLSEPLNPTRLVRRRWRQFKKML
jgi:hypothetical protein